MNEKSLSLTIGTSGAVRKVTPRFTPDPKGRTFHYLLDEQKFITGGATNNGAVIVQWYSEKILKQQVDIKSFGEQAAAVPPGSEGLLFLPYLLGERAPVYDPEASGVFLGIRKHHTSAHFMRAILEGIGYSLFSIAGIVAENSGFFEAVIASGGFIQSPHWVQIIADIFGKEVQVRGLEDASTLGAAMMGFHALGVKTDFQFPEGRHYDPNLDVHKRYQAYFTVYQNLYPRLSESFHSLHQIDNP
jgi:gluconokinase